MKSSYKVVSTLYKLGTAWIQAIFKSFKKKKKKNVRTYFDSRLAGMRTLTSTVQDLI